MEEETRGGHEKYMQRCIALAKLAKHRGESPVGSIIVYKDQVIGYGVERSRAQQDITYHAEIEAIRRAAFIKKTRDLSDCTLYTTHEPCIMCSYAIRYYKIAKVIYHSKASYLGGISSVVPLLITNEVPPHWSDAPVIIQLKAGK